MSIAVVAEKPSVARDIAKVLGVRQRGEGFLHGNGYVVTWAVGHLVRLAEPHEIDPAWLARSAGLWALPSCAGFLSATDGLAWEVWDAARCKAERPALMQFQGIQVACHAVEEGRI